MEVLDSTAGGLTDARSSTAGGIILRFTGLNNGWSNTEMYRTQQQQDC